MSRDPLQRTRPNSGRIGLRPALFLSLMADRLTSRNIIKSEALENEAISLRLPKFARNPSYNYNAYIRHIPHLFLQAEGLWQLFVLRERERIEVPKIVAFIAEDVKRYILFSVR